MKYVFSMTLALALLASAPALADRDKSIDVMTQNQYLGADLTPIIVAEGPVEFNAALLMALQDIAANNYPARAKKLAELIADRSPELVGLQEMFQFVCYETGFLPGACVDPSLVDPPIVGAFNDHLQATLDELAELGVDYVDVATVDNLDLTGVLGIPNLPLPGLPVDVNLDGSPDITVTILDRDVILAGKDVTKVSPVDYSGYCPDRESADGCNYNVLAPTPLEAVPFIQRGWVGVDVTVRNKKYRFVNTHLEVQEPEEGNALSSIFQAAQAAELIFVLGESTPSNRSLIVVGDINSSSEDSFIPFPGVFPPPFQDGIIPPYMLFVGSGYTDAWDFADEPGFSCCQLADLSNPQSILDERIDVIFSIEVPKNVEKTRVLGANIQDKTLPGPRLWPSDHGSVAAELEF